MESHKLRIAIATLGCKVNFFESAGIVSQFPDVELVDFDEPADVYIINTCTVTNRTDYKSRNLIRKALRRKEQDPKAKVIVTGCFAQRSSEEIRTLGDIDFIVDNQSKLDIDQILTGNQREFLDIMAAETFAYRPVDNMLGHTRAFQKIQDGCDFYCHYCAVPYARGHSRSARFEDVVSQARLFALQGFKEIVLGGVNLGLYHDNRHNLSDVIKAIADIDEIKLIRLSSIEPQLFDKDLLGTARQVPKLCMHFHIPVQSGSDTILSRMGRRYKTEDVRSLVQRVVENLPNPAIGFDLITGFPGETLQHHDETIAFVSSLPIAYLHVFSYSKRKGTPAASMKAQVDKEEKKARTASLAALSQQKSARFQQQLVQSDQVLRGIIEKERDGLYEFLSDRYLRIGFRGEHKVGDYASIPASQAVFLRSDLES